MQNRARVTQIKQGEKTSTIYGWIRDGSYRDAITQLQQELYTNINSRAALSLLGYCYCGTQQFHQAIECYDQLVQLYPDNRSYHLNLVKCYYQADEYDSAMRYAQRYIERFPESIDDRESFATIELIKLQSAIKYASDNDLVNGRALLDRLPNGNIDKEANIGCMLYKEKRYDESIERFHSCLQMENVNVGTSTKLHTPDRVAHTSPPSTTNVDRKRAPDLLYNLAICHYRENRYAEAMKYIGEIIEQGIREHPELSVGMNTEGLEVRSVGNTEVLHRSVLIEAFNLKAAIEYQSKNYDAAREALTDMPPRSESELDAITLHNTALVTMDTNPVDGFEKLQFLITQDAFPPETFANLVLLYCKHDYYELAADLMAENASYTYQYLSSSLYEFLDALITQQTSPEEAYRKFDEIAARHIEALRKQSKLMNELQASNAEEQKQRRAQDTYQSTLDFYIPVLMAQAKIYWDLENYEQVEKVFRQSAEFCNKLDVWKLNVAHVLFMQENKFKEAAGFYEQLVKANYAHILDCSPIVLANLCVSYIMIGQNEDAEELMRKIEKEEEQLVYADPECKVFHLCIVNLVIGTLYCSKGNYEFGITRVIKSLDPYPKKLGTDTWFYTKRCFLAMLDMLARQVIVVKDSVLRECIQFLEQCERYGKLVKIQVEAPLELATLHPGKNTVTYEARLLRALLLQLMEQ